MNGILPAIAISGMMVWTAGAASVPVTVVCDPGLPASAGWGLEVLEEALGKNGAELRRGDSVGAAEGRLIVAGIATSGGPAAQLLKEQDVAPPVEAEGLVVKRVTVGGREALVLCGADARGLMYALLDAAGQVSACRDPEIPAGRRPGHPRGAAGEGTGGVDLHHAAPLVRAVPVRRGLLAALLRAAGLEPHQQLRGRLRIRERRLHGARPTRISTTSTVSRTSRWSGWGRSSRPATRQPSSG